MASATDTYESFFRDEVVRVAELLLPALVGRSDIKLGSEEDYRRQVDKAFAIAKIFIDVREQRGDG